MAVRPTTDIRSDGHYEDLYKQALALQPSTDAQRTLQALALKPSTDAQRTLQAQALKLVGETGQMRWLLFAQEQGTSIPASLLVVLVAWLSLLLASFGLLAPGNATVVLSLAVCALTASSAVFLILDLAHPFEGIIRISGEPLRVAMEQVGR